jgi:TonB family protein
MRFDLQNRHTGLVAGEHGGKSPFCSGGEKSSFRDAADRVPDAAASRHAGGTRIAPRCGEPSGTDNFTGVFSCSVAEKNVQGRVAVKALISKDGRLRNIRLVGPPSLLSGSVLEAVKKWRYQPRVENGMPVEVGTQITIDFEK